MDGSGAGGAVAADRGGLPRRRHDRAGNLGHRGADRPGEDRDLDHTAGAAVARDADDPRPPGRRLRPAWRGRAATAGPLHRALPRPACCSRFAPTPAVSSRSGGPTPPGTGSPPTRCGCRRPPPRATTRSRPREAGTSSSPSAAAPPTIGCTAGIDTTALGRRSGRAVARREPNVGGSAASPRFAPRGGAGTLAGQAEHPRRPAR